MKKHVSYKQVLAVLGVVILIILAALAYIYINDRLNETTFFVVFNSNGGTRIPGQSVKINEKVEKPDDPTKEGYTFLYWAYLKEEYNFDIPVTNNITLNAVWEENKEN